MNLRLVGERQINALLYPEANAIQAERPRTRGDCVNGPRPCPWVGCRHHLYLNVDEDSGAITLNFPAPEDAKTRMNAKRGPEEAAVPVWELQHSCSLDVAEMGGLNLTEMGEQMRLTKERIRQIEEAAKTEMRNSGIDLGREPEPEVEPWRPPPGPSPRPPTIVAPTKPVPAPQRPPVPRGPPLCGRAVQLRMWDPVVDPSLVHRRRPTVRREMPPPPQLMLWSAE